MRPHDCCTAGDHDRNGGSGNADYPFPALFGIPSGQTDAEVYTVSWQGASGGRARSIGYLLPKGCQYLYRKSWYSGSNLYCRGGSAPCMETENAAVHCGRNDSVYDFNAGCLCLKQVIVGSGVFVKIFACTSKEILGHDNIKVTMT